MRPPDNKPPVFLRLTREELDHLDTIHRLVAEALIKTGEIELIPGEKIL